MELSKYVQPPTRQELLRPCCTRNPAIIQNVSVLLNFLLAELAFDFHPAHGRVVKKIPLPIARQRISEIVSRSRAHAVAVQADAVERVQQRLSRRSPDQDERRKVDRVDGQLDPRANFKRAIVDKTKAQQLNDETVRKSL